MFLYVFEFERSWYISTVASRINHKVTNQKSNREWSQRNSEDLIWIKYHKHIPKTFPVVYKFLLTSGITNNRRYVYNNARVCIQKLSSNTFTCLLRSAEQSHLGWWLCFARHKIYRDAEPLSEKRHTCDPYVFRCT